MKHIGKTIKLSTLGADPDYLWVLLGMSLDEYQRRKLCVRLIVEEMVTCVDGILFDGIPFVGDIHTTCTPDIGIEMSIIQQWTTNLTCAQWQEGLR